MRVEDSKGRLIWRAGKTGQVSASGAFQYTTESVAEALLREFLATRAKAN
jgi:hypothetical protein